MNQCRPGWPAQAPLSTPAGTSPDPSLILGPGLTPESGSTCSANGEGHRDRLFPSQERSVRASLSAPPPGRPPLEPGTGRAAGTFSSHAASVTLGQAPQNVRLPLSSGSGHRARQSRSQGRGALCQGASGSTPVREARPGDTVLGPRGPRRRDSPSRPETHLGSILGDSRTSPLETARFLNSAANRSQTPGATSSPGETGTPGPQSAPPAVPQTEGVQGAGPGEGSRAPAEWGPAGS